jgi:hypothetical protein
MSDINRLPPVYAKQLARYRDLVRIKRIGHPACEGFEQHYDRSSGLYAGRVETVDNFGIGYRAYPSTLATGRLCNTLEEALDYLEAGS